MYDLTIYTRDSCIYCIKLKDMLGLLIARERGLITITYIDWNCDIKERLQAQYNVEIKTLPVVIVNGEYIGGYHSFISWCSVNLFTSMMHLEEV